MKKAVSILLSVIMVMSMFSVCAFGEWNNEVQANWTEDITVSESVTETSSLVTTGTITVAEGTVLTIATGASIIFSGNKSDHNLINKGKIIVKGSLNFTNGASFQNNGIIVFEQTNGIYGKGFIGSDCVCYNAGSIQNSNFDIMGVLKHKVSICGDKFATYSGSDMYNKTQTDITFTVTYALADDLSSENEYAKLDTLQSPANSGVDIYVPEGKIVYVKLSVPKGTGDFIDLTRIKLSAGATLVENTRGVYRILVTSPVSVDVASSLAYKNVVKQFKIELPYTEGYRVVTFDGIGEDITTTTTSSSSGLDLSSLFSDDEEEDTSVYATVEYGKMLTFRVELKDGYKNSADSVKVYIDANEIECDEYGYYDITGPFVTDETTGNTYMSSAGGVQSEFTIRVMGVASDELDKTMNSVVSYIQQIFSIIKSFFQFFASIFDGTISTEDLGNLF